ncbi:hypothetical protein U5903_04140 [Cereibacter johrii]|uniref:hypothetical protein n=1 Tax=Cereibacter johrii TaxID=445629 RepID=UPI002B263399|nr:hypothetical protein [Cereibacter johrii]MEA5159958.1 hypothetical protein [Cereibacter johrii]
MSTNRTFTKRMLVMNNLAAWGVVLYAVHSGTGEAIMTPLLGLLGFLFAAYTGTGHLDYRAFLSGGPKGEEK